MNVYEKKLSEKLKNVSKESTPGFHLMVAKKGKVIADLRWGKTWTYYDLASLTKIIFTTTQWMGLESQNVASVEKKVQAYLPWYPYKSTVRGLLTHTAGNEWWRPFYKTLAPLTSVYEKKQRLRELIKELNPKNTSQSLYSDIDFFLLGFLMEELRETSLENIWSAYQGECLPDNKMHFNKNNTPLFKKSLYAPTEKCPWRKKVMQGEVHDENTWALGGVSSHAGLFGRAQDVMQWGLWLRSALRSSTTFVDKKVAQKFTKRAISTQRGDWALGFMMPTAGHASCGRYFDPGSVGHTGFTGTSFWMDIKSDIIVVLLSNRICPTRKNELFRKERPNIHNAVVEALTE